MFPKPPPGPRISQFAICLGLFFFTIAQPAFGEADRGLERPKTLSQEFERLFEITGATTDDALVTIAKLYGSKGALQTSGIDELVNALNSKPASKSLSEVLEERATVREDRPHDHPGEVTYGNSGSRHDLIMLLWSRAKTLAPNDKDGARRNARAAILLAAHDEFGNGITALIGMLADKDVNIADVSGIAQERRAQLGEISSRIRAQNQVLYGRQQTIVFKSIDSLSASDGAFSPEALKQCLVEITKWRDGSGAAGSRPAAAWQVIHATWQLLNLARSRNDKSSTEMISQVLHDWKKSSDDVYQKRWISEALEITGPAPRKLYNVVSPSR